MLDKISHFIFSTQIGFFIQIFFIVFFIFLIREIVRFFRS